MKKTLKLVVLAIIMLISLTGCASVNYEISINQDGSADINYIVGYSKEFFKGMGVNPEEMSDDSFAEMEEEAKQNGYTIEKYSDDSIIGFKSSKHLDNVNEQFSLKDAFGEEYIKEENGNEMRIEKSLFQTKYILNSNVDLTEMNSNDSENASQTAYMNMFLNQIDIKMKINLPVKVGENNATTVSEDGKSLEWTLKAGQANEIKFEAVQTNIIPIIGIAVVAVAIIAIIIFGIIKNSKKSIGIDPNIDKEFK